MSIRTPCGKEIAKIIAEAQVQSQADSKMLVIHGYPFLAILGRGRHIVGMYDIITITIWFSVDLLWDEYMYYIYVLLYRLLYIILNIYNMHYI